MAKLLHPTYYILFGLLLLLSCETDDEKKLQETENNRITKYIDKYDDEYNIDTLETGIYIIQLKTGLGDTAQNGDKIKFDYVGKILEDKAELDGDSEFVSSYDSDYGPETVTLGEGEIVSGLDKGMPGMRVGDVRIVLMHSDHAYGDVKNGSVPKYSPLIFTVELLEIITANNE